MSDPNNEKNYTQFTKKVTIGCYIALAVAILFFSGLLNNVEGFKWLSALDFATISGKFGTMIDRMVSSPISPEEQAAAVQKLRQIEQVNVDTARRLLGK